MDQIRINNLSSYDDFEANVSSRQITPPKKKSIKETVPFSNFAYDFSAINGEVYWEERQLEYVFEITASTPEELEEKRSAFLTWVMNVYEEEIHDPFIPNHHFRGTFESASTDDDESIEKTTITVVFSAYPYMIANEPKIYTFSVSAGDETTVWIENESSHRITPTFSSDVALTLTHESGIFGLPTGETTDDSFKLRAGENELKIAGTETGTLTITFTEEVF